MIKKEITDEYQKVFNNEQGRALNSSAIQDSLGSFSIRIYEGSTQPANDNEVYELLENAAALILNTNKIIWAKKHENSNNKCFLTITKW